MRGIPCSAVVMADPGFSRRTACPVVTGHIGARRISPAFLGRTRQNIVAIGREPSAGNHSPLLVQHGHGCKPVSQAVNLVNILSHEGAAEVVPWALSDAISCIDGISTLGTQICAPRLVGAIGSSESQAKGVGSCQTT